MSSMESAPVSMPATSAVTFNPVFAPKYPGSFTRSSTREPRPVFAANTINGIKPAEDRRFGSSNDADTDRLLCLNCAYEMPF